MTEKQEGRAFHAEEAAGAATSGKARREQIKRVTPKKKKSGWRELLRKPVVVHGVMIAIVFAVFAALVISWAREQSLYAIGRLADEAVVVRAEFEVADTVATESRREAEMAQAPRVYFEDGAYFDEIENSLLNLPTALADADTLEKVAPEIRQAFGLTQSRLDAIRDYVIAGEADNIWKTHVSRLIGLLRDVPIVDRETYQTETLAQSRIVKLRRESEDPRERLKIIVINIESDDYNVAIERALYDAGLTGLIAQPVLQRITSTPRPTYLLDQAETDRLRSERAETVAPVKASYPVGRLLVAHGEVIDDDALVLIRAENTAFTAGRSQVNLWLSRLGGLGLSVLVTVACSLYVIRFAPRLRRNAARMIAASSLTLVCLLGSAILAAFKPEFIIFAATAPVVFAAVILVIAYDQRTAIVLSAMTAALISVALDLRTSALIIALVGAVAAIAPLHEVRKRDALVRAGALSAAAMASAALVVGLLDYGLVEGVWAHIVKDAGGTALGGMLVGVVTLALLPTIERTFDITTDLTLIELRDPQQPLLRELQRRAPGTYQHSFNVALLAENAAAAIGADSLHLYVGALYHDIGKMNKPDYFVENQPSGFSRHDKLSPAMSLLVIVGHVKDGVELAKEHALPRSLRHYIESHHGTTLVEFFYHVARQKADEEQTEEPREIEYRYPGPKPRTKEAATLMLCDVVESATRTMPDPTPAKIEALVHELAMKRLMDGQFNESALTLRELQQIETSVIKTLVSIHHVRVPYPTDEEKAQLASSTAGREKAQASSAAS